MTAATSLAALAVLLGTPIAGLAQATPGLHALGDVTRATLRGGEIQSSPLALGSTRNPLLRSPLAPQAQERKSPEVAAGLELVLPILGNAYAGNAKRGILPAILRVGGLVAVIAADNVNGYMPDENDTQETIGIVAWVGGLVWGVVTAVRTANAHNRSLSSGNANLSLHPTPDGGLATGMVFRF